MNWQTAKKRNYQQDYWLRKAEGWGIPVQGREKQAAREAESRYRREYRHSRGESKCYRWS